MESDYRKDRLTHGLAGVQLEQPRILPLQSLRLLNLTEGAVPEATNANPLTNMQIRLLGSFAELAIIRGTRVLQLSLVEARLAAAITDDHGADLLDELNALNDYELIEFELVGDELTYIKVTEQFDFPTYDREQRDAIAVNRTRRVLLFYLFDRSRITHGQPVRVIGDLAALLDATPDSLHRELTFLADNYLLEYPIVCDGGAGISLITTYGRELCENRIQLFEALSAIGLPTFTVTRKDETTSESQPKFRERHDEQRDESEIVESGHDYCRVVDNDSERVLTRSEYDAVVERHEMYDMFIDGITRRASVRDNNGACREAPLRNGELQMISHFITTGRISHPSRARGGTQRATAESACKAFESARRKVDVKLDSGAFRAFHHRSGVGEDKLYEFSPPPGMTWCLILPK